MELIGPAGVGKTTLAERVHRADPRVHVGLSLWGLPRTRLVRGAILLVPTVLVSALRKRRLRWREVAQMARLDTLRRVVRRMRSQHRIILLDEGPVFGISSLDLALAKRGGRPPLRWRRRAIRRWARLLDSVVFLDTADGVLATRIRTRAKPHRMMTSSDAAIRRFAADFRRAFTAVLDDLNRAGGVVLHRVRTDGSVPRNAARLRAILRRQRRALAHGR